MEEEELLQECKGHNRRLCEYLSRPETVQKLFEHILRINDIPPPDTNVEPDPVAMKPAKYSFISCEVFLCEIYDLFDTVFRDATILDKLFGVLSTDGPLPPIVPIYFYKCLLVLLQKRAFDTLAYMETRPPSHQVSYAITLPLPAAGGGLPLAFLCLFIYLFIYIISIQVSK